MGERVEISLEEAQRVFAFLEKIHDLMHQPANYADPQCVEKFVAENYEEVRDLYYRVTWNWLPGRIQKQLEER